VNFEAGTISLYKAHRLIARQVEVFVSRKSAGVEHYMLDGQADTDGVFNGVPITTSSMRGDRIIDRVQFCPLLIIAVLFLLHT